MKYQRYLLGFELDVDPSLLGPFRTQEERDTAAKEWLAKYGPDGMVYKLDITRDGTPFLYSYSGADIARLAPDVWEQ